MKRKDIMLPLRYLMGIFMVIIVTVTLMQVGARFVLNNPLVWSDELARFLLIWMVFLGASIVSYDDKHMAVDLFQEKMSPIMKLCFNLFLRILIIGFLIVTIYSSIELVEASHYTKSGALKIPFSYCRVSAAIGSVLMIFSTLLRSIYDVIDYKNGVYPNNNKTEEGPK